MTTRSPKSTSSPAAEPPADELEAFARFCSNALTTEDGSPFALEPFQLEILADYFAGVREIVVLLPKKNGKSSLVGALALWHLLSTPFAEALIVAAARDQAGIVMRQVTSSSARSPQLRSRLKIVQRESGTSSSTAACGFSRATSSASTVSSRPSSRSTSSTGISAPSSTASSETGSAREPGNSSRSRPQATTRTHPSGVCVLARTSSGRSPATASIATRGRPRSRSTSGRSIPTTTSTTSTS